MAVRFTAKNGNQAKARKIPSEMEVAPLHNPFDPLIHNLFKNCRKFKTKNLRKKFI